MENVSLVLASQSPRRKDLLSSCFINFTVVEHEFDEESLFEKNPVKLAEKLAYNKAISIAKKDDFFDKYVLGVDTIVVYKNRIFGKPRSKEEAKELILDLSNKTHKVISGIALINTKENINMVKHCITKVKFGKIDANFLKFYLDNNLWKGYAGGYAIQSIFALLVEKIEGSYSNVVGLPLETLYKMLKLIKYNFFYIKESL